MSTTYDVDYFIEKFKAIPEEEWTDGEFRSPSGACCAFGHCGVRGHTFEKCTKTKQGAALIDIFSSSFLAAKICSFESKEAANARVVANINDGYRIDYKQPTPKQRILAALRDIKSKAA